MKTKLIIAGLMLSSIVANASVTLSGTSIVSSAILGDSQGVFIASNSASFDTTLFTTSPIDAFSFASGTDLFGYTVLGSASINTAGSNGVLGSGVTYDLAGSVGTGNEIGILSFATSTTTALGGDTFSVFTNGWTVPADGSNLPLTGAPNFGLAAVGTGSIVPEPSAYATLAGLVALGFVMLRRRG